ncbi:MAG: tyrosine-type recombinase/integrase [Lachnospiraceae bacterium]|nr:tyrosine-type recombinase/integrase [Lachnospiraceae bacterium]
MSSYHEDQKTKDTLKLREVLFELPDFLSSFMRGISQRTSVKTRLGYAYDLRLFFNYISENHSSLKGTPAKDFKISDLEKITSEDIDLFLDYISYYVKKGNPSCLPQEFKNDEKGKARKLAAIRSMYKYMNKKLKIATNPASIVDTPKIHEKVIVRLEPDEVAVLLDEIESGGNLTKKQQQFHDHTKTRDLALVTLLVGTGMRVSECAGINIDDIDFDTNGVKVIRKGGKEVVLYFGDEVRDSLLSLLEERKKNPSQNANEKALFLSLQGTRLSVRAIQNIVKKYSRVSVKLKNISPHKLRSTYGTNLYRETGDIYLVADVLGHSDVNITKRHYAQIEEERRKSAANIVKLRKG